jgi:hypothetical protein
MFAYSHCVVSLALMRAFSVEQSLKYAGAALFFKVAQPSPFFELFHETL